MKRNSRQTALEMLVIVNLSLTFAFLSQAMYWPDQPLLGKIVRTDDVPRLSVEEALKHLVAQDAIFLDARSRDAFAEAHIATAYPAPYEEGPSSDIMAQVLASPLVILYCDSQTCKSSEKLAKLLVERGIKKLAILDGGIESWKAASLPVSHVIPDPGHAK